MNKAPELHHAGTPVLETDRLLIRPYRVSDAEAMYRNWASSDTVTHYLTWPTHTDVSVSKKLLEMWTAHYTEPDFYHWGIELKTAGEVIGDIAIVHMNEKTACCELGWCLGEKWWGQGIMPEAGHAVVDFLFDTVGFNRIEARHDSRNLKSGRVMQKLGMQCEGISRQADINNQGLHDLTRYAILKEDRL